MIDVVGAVIAKKESDLRCWPVRSNRAGDIGHPCVLFLYLNRTAWDKKPLPSVDLAFIFEAGRRIEDEAIDEIKAAGFMVLEQGRAVDWPQYQISGRLDLKIAEKTQGHPVAIPTEIKGLQGYDCERLNSVQDFLDSEKSWLVKYPAQLLTYLLLTNSPEGLFYIKNKANHRPKQIWVKLDDHLDVAEAAIQRAQKVNAYMEKKATPEEVIKAEGTKFVSYLCTRCDFKHLCPVGTEYTGVEIVINDELEAKFKRREELLVVHKEFEAIDGELKDMFKGKAGETLVGDFMVSSKEIKSTKYEVPKEIKDQYAIPGTQWRTTIKCNKKEAITEGE